MSTHTVAEAKDKLADLIDRALEGEGVVITRDGRPVVELKPILQPPRRMTAADLDWIAAHRVEGAPKVDAGKLVSQMRDDEWT